MHTPSHSLWKHRQFILLLILVFFITTFAAVWHVSQLQSQLIESSAVKNARSFSNALTEFRTLYTSEVVATARQHGLEITHDYATKENAIPLPATLSMLLGKQLGEHTSDSKAQLYSPYPFPWRQKTGGLRDQFMVQAWKFLSQNPDKPFYRFIERDGHKQLRYATADVMRATCVQCHNEHPDTPKNDWETGDLRGVLEVDFPLDQVIAQTRTDLKGTSAIFGAIALLGIISIGSVTNKLRRTSVELQQRVQERTAELTNKATALEHINQELDQFAYIVSHDLKAPLRAIANLSEWIEEDIADDLTDDTRKQMALLRGRVARMGDLINGILQYSRVGRIDNDIESVDVNELLQEIIAGLLVPEGFVIDIAPGMPVFKTPRIPLSQVFANLLSNAIKYHHQPGQGHVEVGVQEVDDEFYAFSVSDDGPGIDPEYHEKVFGIFQTLNARDDVESTGVGLSIVKKIVETRGGKIILESSKGEGSTFRFTVPKTTNDHHDTSQRTLTTKKGSGPHAG